MFRKSILLRDPLLALFKNYRRHDTCHYLRIKYVIMKKKISFLSIDVEEGSFL